MERADATEWPQRRHRGASPEPDVREYLKTSAPRDLARRPRQLLSHSGSKCPPQGHMRFPRRYPSRLRVPTARDHMAAASRAAPPTSRDLRDCVRLPSRRPMLGGWPKAGGLSLHHLQPDGQHPLDGLPDPCAAPYANYDLMLEFMNVRTARVAFAAGGGRLHEDFQEPVRYLDIRHLPQDASAASISGPTARRMRSPRAACASRRHGLAFSTVGLRGCRHILSALHSGWW